MDFDDYKRTMLDIEMPSGLNARTYSRIVQKDAGELLEEEPRVEPYAISAKVGRRPRKRYYVGIGACAAAARGGAYRGGAGNQRSAGKPRAFRGAPSFLCG